MHIITLHCFNKSPTFPPALSELKDECAMPSTAKRSITGIETMRMVQKGKVKYIGKGGVRAQNEFIRALFNVNVAA